MHSALAPTNVAHVSSRLLTTKRPASVIVRGGDRDEAVFRLPSTYQRVMAWLAEDVAPEEIAKRLRIDPNALPALIELATAKFARAAEEARRQKEQ